MDSTSGLSFDKKPCNPNHQGQRSVYRALQRSDTLPRGDGNQTYSGHEGSEWKTGTFPTGAGRFATSDRRLAALGLITGECLMLRL